MKDIQLWELQDISYFNTGIGMHDMYYEKVKLLFDYVCSMVFEKSEGMWWNDDFEMNFDAEDAMCFMTDYIEENKNHLISIECVSDRLNVLLKCEGCSYFVTESIINDAHTKLFEMMIWVMAKSLGFTEEE
jgi:hypothetical protein